MYQMQSPSKQINPVPTEITVTYGVNCVSTFSGFSYPQSHWIYTVCSLCQSPQLLSNINFFVRDIYLFKHLNCSIGNQTPEGAHPKCNHEHCYNGNRLKETSLICKGDACRNAVGKSQCYSVLYDITAITKTNTVMQPQVKIQPQM